MCFSDGAEQLRQHLAVDEMPVCTCTCVLKGRSTCVCVCVHACYDTAGYMHACVCMSGLVSVHACYHTASYMYKGICMSVYA